MRLLNLALVFLLFCFSAQSWGAILCDGVDDIVTITDDSDLTLPDGDFTLSIWVKNTDGTGLTATGRPIGWNDGAGAQFNISMLNAAGSTDELEVEIDDGPDIAVITSTSSPFSGNTAWTNIIIERESTTFTVYVNGTSIGTAAVGSVDAVNVADDLTFCNRVGGGRHFDGSVAEAVKWNRALNAGERAALVAGFAPNCIGGFVGGSAYYFPFVRDYVELVNASTVTNGAGGTATTVTAHPRMIYCGQ